MNQSSFEMGADTPISPPGGADETETKNATESYQRVEQKVSTNSVHHPTPPHPTKKGLTAINPGCASTRHDHKKHSISAAAAV